MLDGFVFHHQTGILEMADHIGIRLMDIPSGKVRDFRSEASLLVDRTDWSDVCLAANPVVVFTECRSDMNDAGTFVGSHEIGSQNLKELRRTVAKVREERFVAKLFVNELAAIRPRE